MVAESSSMDSSSGMEDSSSTDSSSKAEGSSWMDSSVEKVIEDDASEKAELDVWAECSEHAAVVKITRTRMKHMNEIFMWNTLLMNR